MKKYIGKIKHVYSRIKAYKNWYVLIWPITRLMDKSRVIITRSGRKMYARNIFGPDFVVIHEMFSRDDYNINSILFNNSSPIIIDAGANIGAFSILAANKFRNAKIFAYEPEKSNLDMIVKNIELNNFGNIIFPYQLAVDATEGKKMFFLSEDEYAHSLVPGQFSNKAGEKEVFCTTIEQIMREHNLGRIDILKLDIEGTEYDLLYSLPNNIYQNISYIVLEIHDRSGYSKEELIAFLKNKNFSVQQSEKNRHVYFAKNTNAH